MRVLELFAGIGGLAAAFPKLKNVGAVDIDQAARAVYLANFQHSYFVREIASLPLEWLSHCQADAWWMSPPCTPFTKRGARRDLKDPRSDALKHLIHAVSAIRPRLVCLENVVGFESSDAFDHLHSQWTRVGYHLQTCTLCPSTLGWPNRRPRVYCLASLETQPTLPRPSIVEPKLLSEFVDLNIRPESNPSLWLSDANVERYFEAIDRVSLSNPLSVTACFASSYGNSIVRSGSYLETPTGYRRFSPREVARLLGFENDFQLPENLSQEKQWHLLGNSLSLPAVRHVFGGILQ